MQDYREKKRLSKQKQPNEIRRKPIIKQSFTNQLEMDLFAAPPPEPKPIKAKPPSPYWGGY